MAITVADKRRRLLKQWARRQLRDERDRLAEGASPRWRGALVLASLQACAMRMGWDYEKVSAHVYPMCDRIPEIVLYGRA